MYRPLSEIELNPYSLGVQLSGFTSFSQAHYQSADKVRQAILGIFKDRQQGAFEDFSTDWHGEPIFQQQYPHLIDSGSAFDDETLTDAMSRLQCQLLMRFQRDTAHSALG